MSDIIFIKFLIDEHPLLQFVYCWINRCWTQLPCKCIENKPYSQRYQVELQVHNSVGCGINSIIIIILPPSRMDRNNFTPPDCHIIAEILLTDNSVERIE